MRELLLALMLLSAEQNNAKAGLVKKLEQTKQMIWISDRNGVVNPQSVLNIKIEQNIKVYATDGSGFEGVVESIKIENDQVYKVFGTVTNRSNAAFGFAITKDGNFAGSILLQDDESLYTVEFSEKHNGLILKKTAEAEQNNTNKTTIK